MPCDLYAAWVREVDRKAREVRVEVPPHTDGASEWPIAEINYPIGDDSTNTEIRIPIGQPVWVAFHNGDARYPVIMGSRNPRTGNVVGMRRFNHDNFELNADQVFTINAGTEIALNVGGTQVKLTGDMLASIAGAHTIKGPVTQTGGDITSDKISVQHHPHTSTAPGTPTSEPRPT